MKIIAVQCSIFLLMATLITGTIETNTALAEEKKERIILKSELKELKLLFDRIDSKIVKIKNKTAIIYNLPDEMEEKMQNLLKYHPLMKETAVILDKAIKADEETSGVLPEEVYISIKLMIAQADDIDRFLDTFMERLKKDFPEYR